jgi:hypothetical protein
VKIHEVYRVPGCVFDSMDHQRLRTNHANRDAMDLALATYDPCLSIRTLEALDSMGGLRMISSPVGLCVFDIVFCWSNTLH